MKRNLIPGLDCYPPEAVPLRIHLPNGLVKYSFLDSVYSLDR